MSETVCTKCEGTGMCQSCNGYGYFICGSCEGDGVETCPSCGGVAHFEDEEGNLMQCYDCGGEGTVPCRDCEGTGTLYCEECDGTGRCNMCDGNGVMS